MNHPAEKPIRIAAQLYDIRDTVKRTLGAKYLEQMAGFGAIVKGLADSQRISVIEAATHIGKDPSLSPYTVLFVMAAAVELLEPST